MSIPFESNATAWAAIRAIDAWIEYPFANDGDTTSKIYKMVCMCKSTEYEAPLFSQTMSDAATAKLIELPFAADATAYFVGDDGFAPAGATLITFTRSFMPVPATRTRGIGSYSYTWPAFREWNDSTQGNYTTVFNPQNELVPPDFITRDPLTASSPATVTYTFTYATSISSVSADVLWEPKWSTSTAIDLSYRGLPTGNYVCNANVSGSSSNLASVPSITTYKNYIGNTFLIVASSIKSYKGNIYVKETIKALAQ